MSGVIALPHDGQKPLVMVGADGGTLPAVLLFVLTPGLIFEGARFRPIKKQKKLNNNIPTAGSKSSASSDAKYNAINPTARKKIPTIFTNSRITNSPLNYLFHDLRCFSEYFRISTCCVNIAIVIYLKAHAGICAQLEACFKPLAFHPETDTGNFKLNFRINYIYFYAFAIHDAPMFPSVDKYFVNTLFVNERRFPCDCQLCRLPYRNRGTHYRTSPALVAERGFGLEVCAALSAKPGAVICFRRSRLDRRLFRGGKLGFDAF
jgi:hypothetical protein